MQKKIREKGEKQVPFDLINLGLTWEELDLKGVALRYLSVRLHSSISACRDIPGCIFQEPAVPIFRTNDSPGAASCLL